MTLLRLVQPEIVNGPVIEVHLWFSSQLSTKRSHTLNPKVFLPRSYHISGGRWYFTQFDKRFLPQESENRAQDTK